MEQEKQKKAQKGRRERNRMKGRRKWEDEKEQIGRGRGEHLHVAFGVKLHDDSNPTELVAIAAAQFLGRSCLRDG